MYWRNQPLRNLFMGYYRQAIAEIERGVVVIVEENGAKLLPHGLSACQGVPIVGPSIDRRTFGHPREVYNDTAICSLICFVCAQRRTHTVQPNSAIQRRNLEFFAPEKNQGASEALRIKKPQQYLRNFCQKTYLHRFAREGTPLWNAKFLGTMENGELVSNVIGMPQSGEEDPEEAWEWRRLYLAEDGCFWNCNREGSRLLLPWSDWCSQIEHYAMDWPRRVKVLW